MKKPTYPVGVSVLITRQDDKDGVFSNTCSILMGIRKNNSLAGFWYTPGGRIEPEETMTECAVREVKEETNLTVIEKDLERLGVIEHFRSGKHYFMIYFWAPQFKGKLKNTEPDKREEWVWKDIRKLGDIKHTEPPEIIECLRRKMRESLYAFI